MQFSLHISLVALLASIAASQLVDIASIISYLDIKAAEASKLSSIIAKDETAAYITAAGYSSLLDKVDNLNSKFTQTYSIHTTPTIGTDAEATRKASASVVREFYKDYYDTLQKFVATQTLVTGSARESIVSNVKEEKKVIDEALQKAGEGNGAERVVKGGLAAVVVAVAAAVIVL